MAAVSPATGSQHLADVLDRLDLSESDPPDHITIVPFEQCASRFAVCIRSRLHARFVERRVGIFQRPHRLSPPQKLVLDSESGGECDVATKVIGQVHDLSLQIGQICFFILTGPLSNRTIEHSNISALAQ